MRFAVPPSITTPQKYFKVDMNAKITAAALAVISAFFMAAASAASPASHSHYKSRAGCECTSGETESDTANGKTKTYTKYNGDIKDYDESDMIKSAHGYTHGVNGFINDLANDWTEKRPHDEKERRGYRYLHTGDSEKYANIKIH